MRKAWECSLRWRWLRCLCLLLASSILLLNTSIESNASESNGDWGNYIYLEPMQAVTRMGNPFYVSSYALLDMEEYESGANGYFRNTVPGTFQGETTISYNIPLYTLNNNSSLKIDSDSLNVSFEVLGIRPVLGCNLGGATVRANLFNSKIQEIYVLYNGQKYYGNYDSRNSYADFNFMISGLSGDTRLSDFDMTLCFVLQNTVTLVTNEDVTRFVSAEYTPTVSFELGRETSNIAVTLRPYYLNDRVVSNIQNQTEEISGVLNEQTEIQQSQLEESEKQTVEMEEQTETQKGIWQSIKDFFGSFFDNLINSVIHVFVPTEEQMNDIFGTFFAVLDENLGFLYQSFELVVSFFETLVSSDSETILTFPSFSIMGYEVWPDMSYDLASDFLVSSILEYVRKGTGFLICCWLVNYMRNFFDKRFGGGAA